MAAITLGQALAASEAIDDINASLNNLTARTAQIQAVITQLATINVANAQAQANAQLAAVQALITTRNTELANQTATVVAYNQANPGAPVPVG